jgi:hypothetical protein
MGDYTGQVLAEVSALRLIKPTSTYLPFSNFSGMLKQGDKIRSKVRLHWDYKKKFSYYYTWIRTFILC